MDYLRFRCSWTTGFALLLAVFSLFPGTYQQKYFTTYDANGKPVLLEEGRRPALYTRDFGDCLGSSVVNVTKFNAAYYADNMTVIYHLEGMTSIHNESLMMHIGVFAYGQNRFDLTFDPCNANIRSLCPMKKGVPIQASGAIPIAQSDVQDFPAIAYTIPDFEGQAIVRLFANSTRSEIACYSGVVTNGASFSHPEAVASTLGAFTAIAVIASVVSSVYGDSIVGIRPHYAHSLSIFVVFSVFQHIYFTGALAVNWPSVLVAFWSNYAWSGGMVYIEPMQNAINQFLGANKGNTSMVGAAGPGSVPSPGPLLQKIYRRSAAQIYVRDLMFDAESMLRTRRVEHALAKRAESNSTGSTWFGSPVAPGLPLPGNFSGFGGTLAQENIPQSNAFMTSLLWFLVVIAGVAVSMVLFKVTMEILSFIKLTKAHRLGFYRARWFRYTGLAVLRTVLIGFFTMTFLTLFQLTIQASQGVTAVAATGFAIFVGGLFFAVAYACYYRLYFGHYESGPDRLNFERTKILKIFPWYYTLRESQRDEKHSHRIFAFSLPWWRIHFVDEDPQRIQPHEDENYIRKFGWLAARFRRTRWWFFSAWLLYEFVRACFYALAQAKPRVQVLGLLVVEIIALIAIFFAKPFESSRLNVLMVYLLGFSKVSTLALSVAFDSRYNMNRISTTIIGIVIIVIQGVLTIVLLIAIIVGAISTYFSVTRNREQISPKSWTSMRNIYLRHIHKVAADLPPPPPPRLLEPVQPYFSINSIHRVPKIEDEGPELAADLPERPISKTDARHSRASSLGASSMISHKRVPFGGYVHRQSWSLSEVFGTGEMYHPTGGSRTASRNSTGLRDAGPSRASTRESTGNHQSQSMQGAAGNNISRGPSRLSKVTISARNSAGSAI